MSAQIAAYGRLGRDPRPVDTSSGKAMTVASVAVTGESRESGETGEGTLWLDVVSFGRVADDLARHAKGDLVSVAGRMQLSRFTSSTSGEVRESWQVVADALVSARTVRPKGGRRSGADKGGKARSGDAAAVWPTRGPGGGEARERSGRSAGEPFDDALPF